MSSQPPPDDYELRKVGLFLKDIKGGKITVSTTGVIEGYRPFETAIRHPLYNDDSYIVVEAYDTREEAELGHDRWVRLMTSDHPPYQLEDCYNSGIARFIMSYNGPMIYERGF